MLNTVRQLVNKHGWKGGPGAAMIEYHSKKLLNIRSLALSKKYLLLQSYAYLRDAHVKQFYHESMTRALWTHIGTMNNKSNTDGGSRNNNTRAAPKCSWCKGTELHRAMSIQPYKNVCPLRESSANKARAIAKKFKEQFSNGDDAVALLDRLKAE